MEKTELMRMAIEKLSDQDAGRGLKAALAYLDDGDESAVECLTPGAFVAYSVLLSAE